MDRSAHTALPSPYSKIFPAFGAGAAFTYAAGLGGKRFIDFRKPHACVSAFIADEDGAVGLDQIGAQFVQEIFSPIRDLGVNHSGPSDRGSIRRMVPNSGIPRAGHPYSIPKNHPRILGHTSRNVRAGMKAGVSRGEIR
jgi:hypothetical protein